MQVTGALNGEQTMGALDPYWREVAAVADWSLHCVPARQEVAWKLLGALLRACPSCWECRQQWMSLTLSLPRNHLGKGFPSRPWERWVQLLCRRWPEAVFQFGQRMLDCLPGHGWALAAQAAAAESLGWGRTELVVRHQITAHWPQNLPNRMRLAEGLMALSELGAAEDELRRIQIQWPEHPRLPGLMREVLVRRLLDAETPSSAGFIR